MLWHLVMGYKLQPSADLLDNRLSHPTPESGHRAGDKQVKRERGSKMRVAVPILSHCLVLQVIPADEQDCAQVTQLVDQGLDVMDASAYGALVDQGYTGNQEMQATADHGLQIDAAKLPETKKSLVLLRRRWVVHCGLGSATGSRYLTRHQERSPGVLACLHLLNTVSASVPGS